MGTCPYCGDIMVKLTRMNQPMPASLADHEGARCILRTPNGVKYFVDTYMCQGCGNIALRADTAEIRRIIDSCLND